MILFYDRKCELIHDGAKIECLTRDKPTRLNYVTMSHRIADYKFFLCNHANVAMPDARRTILA